jgi:hypothetical protein
MGNVWANSGDRVDADAAKKLSRVTELDNQTTDSDDEDGTSSAESASAGSSDDDLDAMPACGNCGMEATFEKPLFVCKKCDSQHYCTKKCQKAHWPTHKKLCSTSTVI